MNIDHWRTGIVTASAIGQTVFVAMYLLYPWYKSFLGRVLFLHAVALAALLDLGAIARWNDWNRETAAFAIFSGALAITIWGQVAAFVRVMTTSERPTLEAEHAG